MDNGKWKMSARLLPSEGETVLLTADAKGTAVAKGTASPSRAAPGPSGGFTLREGKAGFCLYAFIYCHISNLLSFVIRH